MKNKSLAIALMLALLCSLFAFSVPVSARTVSQANDNAGFFEFTLYFSHFTWVDRANYDNPDWMGAPIEFEGKPLPGRVSMQGETIMDADIDGYFGEGVGHWYWNMTVNFVTGRAVEYTYWVCEFDNEEWQGSFTFLRVHKREFAAWRAPTDDEDFRADYTTIFRSMTLTDSSGDFENFHFQKKADINPIPPGEIFPQITAWGKFT